MLIDIDTNPRISTSMDDLDIIEFWLLKTYIKWSIYFILNTVH